jgi:hypothetical protein
MSVTLPILGALRTKFPKWESSKINPEKVACFSSPNPHHQLTTLSPAIHHKFTTKNHVPTTRFHQNPQQKRTPTTPKKITAKALPIEAEDLRFPNPRKLSDYGEWPKDIPKSQARKVGHSIGQRFERVSFLSNVRQAFRSSPSRSVTLEYLASKNNLPYDAIFGELENTLLTSRRCNLLV